MNTITMLSAGFAPQYVREVVNALGRNGLDVDLIGSDDYLKYEYHPKVKLLNFRGNGNNFINRIVRVIKYPILLVLYILRTENRVIHVQWNKFLFSEGVILNLFIKFCGKKIVHTAHNILPHNRQHVLKNRVIYKIIYALADKIIVHTAAAKTDLLKFANIKPAKIVVCPHGIYSEVDLSISRNMAKSHLNLNYVKNVLFFGALSEYKGIDILISALTLLNSGKKEHDRIGLIIAGRGPLSDTISDCALQLTFIKPYLRYIKDEEIPYFFHAADAVVLPYKKIDQSGVLFMALAYGVPTVATNVGSFSEYIFESDNGAICEPHDPHGLAAAIDRVLHNPDLHRESIRKNATLKYNWDDIVKDYINAYNSL